MEELIGHVDGETEEAIAKPSKKKLKLKSEDEGHEEAASEVNSLSAAHSSAKPMERKKKRKALDKERRLVATENAEPNSNGSGPNMKSDDRWEPLATSPMSVLPEFHISVFKNLASADVSTREVAAEALTRELQEVQKAYDRLEEKERAEGLELQLEAEKDDGLKNCAPSLRYAVRRLIRGVSSSRECARQGFALGLTMLGGKIPSIRVEPLLKLVVDLLEVSSSMKGQEARDCLLGRLFAYGAVARSGRLIEEWNHDKTTPYIKEFTSLLISLASKKRYLQEPAISIILELVEKLPNECLVNQVLEALGLDEWFKVATEVGNPDALLLALKIREKISVDNVIFAKLLPHPFSPSKFFATDHLSSLVNCLKESTFCQPRVHSVWPVLVNILLPDTVLRDGDVLSGSSSIKKHRKSRKSNSSEEEIVKNVRNFCETIIEESLLMSSHDRKHLALDVLLLLLPKLPASCISIVVSYKIVQCLMDILSTKDSWLYKVAEHFLKKLSDWVKNDDVRRVAVIVALQKHSNGRFDCITRTKTVKDLLAEFKTESGCLLFIQNLISMFLNEGSASEEPSDQSLTTDDNSEMGSNEEKDSVGGAMNNSEILKSWVIESLPSILKYLKLDAEAKYRIQKEILKFLAVQGLFCSSLGNEVTSFELQEKFRWPKAPTSTSLCRVCIEQIQQLLANAQKGEVAHGLASGLEPNDLGSYFMRFLGTLCNIPSVSLFRTLSSEDEKAFKKLQAMETQLLREEKTRGLSTGASRVHALRYLLIQLVLQILLRPEEFSEAASELIICCKKAFVASDNLDSDGEEEEESGGMPVLMDVLVDTLLSLLPQSSAPMRSAIEQVFKYFCDDITDDGLLRMLRVIKKDLQPSRHHQDPASEDHDDDEDDDDFLGIEEDDESDEAETGETRESDEHNDDLETVEESEVVDKELPEGSDDSDGGMDDDAMFRMDSYLARIFKERKSQGGDEPAHQQLILFKLRVLSLLEIYLHQNPDKPQVLTVYSNLAQAFVNPHTAEGSVQLGQRIWGILQKKILKAKEYPKGETLQLSILESLLERNLKLASKPFKKKKSANNPSKKKQSASLNRYKMITSLGQDSTFWILKIIDSRKFSELELQRVFDVFRSTLTAFFDSKKSNLKAVFVKEIFKRRSWIGYQLLGFLLEKCGNAKSEFRQVEALDFVNEILKSLVSVSKDNNKNSQEVSKKVLKSHLPKLCHLIKELVNKMPEKQSRRAEVRKFCGKVFQIVSTLGLNKSFLKVLEVDAHGVCDSQLGDVFLALKKQR